MVIVVVDYVYGYCKGRILLFNTFLVKHRNRNLKEFMEVIQGKGIMEVELKKW